MKRTFSVLVINISALGDLVSGMVVIDALQKRFGEIHCLTRPEYSSLFDTDHDVTVVSAEMAAGNTYQYLVDLTSSSESCRLVKKIEARGKIGRHTGVLHWLRRRLVYHTMVSKKQYGHIVRDFWPLVAHFGDNLQASPRLQRQLNGQSSKYDSLAGSVGIHVGAGIQRRILPRSLAIGIVQIFQKRGVQVVLVGDEKPLIDEIIAKTAGYPLFIPTTVGELRMLMEQFALFVGTDSGPLHLAASLGVPVVGIYGPNFPSCSGPIAHLVRFVDLDLDCRPCKQAEPCLNDLRCVRGISLQQVQEAIDQLWAS